MASPTINYLARDFQTLKEKKTTFIYCLTDPRTLHPRYLGKSNNPKLRLWGHTKDIPGTYKNNWIQSLLKQGLQPILEIIDEVAVEEWQFWEKHYISLYKSWGFELTNATEGGDGGKTVKNPWNKGKKMSKEFCNKVKFGLTEEGKQEKQLKKQQKLKDKQLNLITPEARKKAVQTRKNNNNPWHTKETKQKLSLSHLGKESVNKGKTLEEICGTERAQQIKENLKSVHLGKEETLKTREKKRNCRIGKKHSLETKAKLARSNKRTGMLRRGAKKNKPIIATNLITNTQYSFDSISKASKTLQIPICSIRNVLNKNLLSYKSFTFKLVNNCK